MADDNTGDTEQQAPATGEPLGDAGKAALEAERRDRKAAQRELTATKARLEELENAGKTEQQRLEERAATAERELPTLRTESVRLKFALEKIGELESLEQVRAFVGIADRLRGDTAEELAADADVLLPKLLPAAPATDQQGRPASSRPVATLTPGASAAPVVDPGPGQPRLMSALADYMK